MSYLTDKLKEVIDKRYDEGNWSPNNFRAMFMGQNFFCFIRYSGVPHVVKLDFEKVKQDVQKSFNGRGASFDPIMNNRKFSCLEEIYIDTIYLNSKLFNLESFVRSLNDNRLRYYGVINNLRDSEQLKIINSIKSCFNSKLAAQYGYLYITDPNNVWKGSQIPGKVAKTSNNKWYTSYNLRPTDYEMDKENGDLDIYFKKVEKAGIKREGPDFKTLFVERMKNDYENYFLRKFYLIWEDLRKHIKQEDFEKNTALFKLYAEIYDHLMDVRIHSIRKLMTDDFYKECKNLLKDRVNVDNQEISISRFFDFYFDVNQKPFVKGDERDIRDYSNGVFGKELNIDELVTDLGIGKEKKDLREDDSKWGIINISTLFHGIRFLLDSKKYSNDVEDIIKREKLNIKREDIKDLKTYSKKDLKIGANILFELVKIYEKGRDDEIKEKLTECIFNFVINDCKLPIFRYYLEYLYYLDIFVKEVLENKDTFTKSAYNVLKMKKVYSNINYRITINKEDFSYALKELYSGRSGLFTTALGLAKIPQSRDEFREIKEKYPNYVDLMRIYDILGILTDNKTDVQKVIELRKKGLNVLVKDKEMLISVSNALYEFLVEKEGKDFARLTLNACGLKVVSENGIHKVRYEEKEEYFSRAVNMLSEEEYDNLGNYEKRLKMFIERSVTFGHDTLEKLLTDKGLI